MNKVVDNCFCNMIDIIKQTKEISEKTSEKIEEAFNISGEDTRNYTAFTKFEELNVNMLKEYVKTKWNIECFDIIANFIYDNDFGSIPLKIECKHDNKLSEYEINDSISLQAFLSSISLPSVTHSSVISTAS